MEEKKISLWILTEHSLLLASEPNSVSSYVCIFAGTTTITNTEEFLIFKHILMRICN